MDATQASEIEVIRTPCRRGGLLRTPYRSPNPWSVKTLILP